MKNMNDLNEGMHLAQNVYIDLTNAVGATQEQDRQKYLQAAQNSFNAIMMLLAKGHWNCTKERYGNQTNKKCG